MTQTPASTNTVYLSAFFTCAKLGAKPNGAITAHDISTQINLSSNDPQLSPSQFGAPCLVAFTSDGSKRDFDVSISCVDPSGNSHALLFRQVQSSPGVGGGVIMADTLALTITQTGRYWLDLSIDERQVSRIPLDITYTFNPKVK